MTHPPPPADYTASSASAGLRLLLEPEKADAAYSEFAIDPRGCALTLDANGESCVIPLPASGLSGTDAACVVLEPIEVDRQPALVLAVPPGERVRVNGLSAPPLGMLAVGDVLQVGDRLFHVSWFRAPVIGPPPEALIGVRCNVCFTPVTLESTVLVHDCGSPLHIEPGADQLRCALLGDCADCGRPVVFESGLDYRPAP